MANTIDIPARPPKGLGRLIFSTSVGLRVAIILNLTVCLLVGMVIVASAWRENHTARQRARETVAFAIADLQDAYGRLVTDYAWWDEALDKIAVRHDANWADENIGGWLGRTAKLSAAYAFDDKGRLIYSSAPGRAAPAPLDTLVAAARRMPTDHPDAASGYATIDGRPMVLTAAVLRPMELAPGARYQHVLVFAWDVQTAMLDRLRIATRMDSLQIGMTGDDSLELRDLEGRAILRLSWQPDQPGTRFATWVLPGAGLALLLLSAVGWRYWIRERKHMRALVAAEESRLRLLAAISHDLRQPLQSMALFTATLEREVSSVQGLRAVDLLRRGTERMGDLLGAILRLARLDIQRSGAIPLGPVALDEILAELFDELEPQAAAKGLALRRVRTTVVVFSEAVMLAALLRNLISNAIRYTNRGKVLVGVRRRGGGVEVWVCDTGIGIADHQQQLIFEEFFQVGNAARDAAHGIGLGLSIVERLARHLDCRIRLRSRLGRGSLFLVDLPLRA